VRPLRIRPAKPASFSSIRLKTGEVTKYLGAQIGGMQETVPGLQQ
jgi:hypothetical protein